MNSESLLKCPLAVLLKTLACLRLHKMGSAAGAFEPKPTVLRERSHGMPKPQAETFMPPDLGGVSRE